MNVQGTSKRPFPGLVNFAPAVAYHFCLNSLEAFSQPGNGLLEAPCRASVPVYLRLLYSKAMSMPFGGHHGLSGHKNAYWRKYAYE